MFDSVIVEFIHFMKSIGQANKQTNGDKHTEMKDYSLCDYNKQTNKRILNRRRQKDYNRRATITINLKSYL